jgi:hypothetical protein
MKNNVIEAGDNRIEEEGRDVCMQEHIDIQRRETFREARAVLRERRKKA